MLKGYDDYELTAGDLLRGERATQGMQLLDVASKMKLPLRALKDIEEGVYKGDRPDYLINNIIRDYALFLNLDPDFIKDIYWQEVERKLLCNEVIVVPKEPEVAPASGFIRRIFSQLSQR